MAGERATLTYDMTRLQSLDTSMRFCVSLNSNHRIDPAKVIRRFTYAHPIYTARGIAAQSRHKEISGQRRTHFCGAYWGYGFHEDGVKSALEVAQALGRSLSDA
jgi:predicted NAD/FAD-binding protein